MEPGDEPEPATGKTCPYCGTAFSLEGVNADQVPLNFGRGKRGIGPPLKVYSGPPKPWTSYRLISHLCPSCKGKIAWMNEIETEATTHDTLVHVVSTTLLWPKNPVCRVPTGVPEPLASDFREAHDTLMISPKASAALSRRCLQTVIQDREGIHERNLIDQVKKLLALNKVPSYLAADLDAIRNIGNFAAHPQKNENTGEIVDVEPNEAEWTLEVLEQHLTFYFVEIPKSEARRNALNQKLNDVGHKPML